MTVKSNRWRRSAVLTVAGLTLAGTAGLALPAGSTARVGNDAQPWLATGLTTDQRVNLLLAAMPITDKIAELHADVCPPYEACIPANTTFGLPELVLQDDSTGVTAGMQGVTALPATIAASASWDPGLINRYGTVIGTEERAKGVNVALAPTVNILRAPQWGRSYESLGEDPYLSAQLGAADINGIQRAGILADVKHFAVYNQESDRKTVSADVTDRVLHEIYLPAFAAAVKAGIGSVMSSYNAINGVPNSQNPHLLTTVLRDQLGFQGFVRSDGGGTYSTVPAASAGLDIQVKGKDYLAAPLLTAVQRGQVSLATINSMVRPILTQMFDFHLVGQDWGNGSRTSNVITPTDTSTALDAAEQGTVLLRDQNGVLPLSASVGSIAVIGPGASPGLAEGGGSGGAHLPFLVSPVQGIAAAAPHATISYRAGVPTPQSLASVPNSDLQPAYRAGRAYTGTLTPTMTGRYTLAVRDPVPYTATTVSIDGTPVLRSAGTQGNGYAVGSVQLRAGQHYQVRISGPSTRLAWATPPQLTAAIAQAVAAARTAQVAVVVVGDQESEAADRVNLNLSAGDDQLIAAVAAANPHTVVVLNTGAPVLMPWLNQVAGVVEAWYPGEQDGTALAAVLFGQVNPSGKLPMTFPASAGAIPTASPQQFPGVNGQAEYSEGLDVGYRWYDANNVTPLFPFGFGLSYTTFAFSELAVTPTTTNSLSTVEVNATVTNTGSRPGAEVAQLYVGDPADSGEPPRQLKGFQKVELTPGQSARVRFTVTPQDLATWDSTAHTWVTGEGDYRIMVGDSSAGLPLGGDVRITGTTGTRVVTIHAPTSTTAGSTVTVTAALTAGGDLDLRNVTLSLAVPAGWPVRRIGSGTWQVTVPANTPPDIRQLTATADYAATGGGTGSSVARTQLTVTGSGAPQ